MLNKGGNKTLPCVIPVLICLRCNNKHAFSTTAHSLNSKNQHLYTTKGVLFLLFQHLYLWQLQHLRPSTIRLSNSFRQILTKARNGPTQTQKNKTFCIRFGKIYTTLLLKLNNQT